MNVIPTEIDGVVILEPKVFGDHRGFFMESYSKRVFEEAGLHYDFVPEEHQVRRGPADYTGRICVIGSQLKEDKLSQLFGL